MGKHSNLIFTDEDDTIIDSIKRVPASMSSVREVLPGRRYFIPETQKKRNPLIEGREAFCRQMEGTHTDVVKALYQSYTGLSPAASEEFVFECGIDGRSLFRDLTDTEKETLADVFCGHMERIRNGEFSPHLVMKGREPVEFAVYPTRIYEDSAFSIRPAASVSAMLRQ
jgi:predicted ribosome quality control (RQC) complex YloA/Tae2 family protein